MAFVIDKDWFIGPMISRSDEHQITDIICMRNVSKNKSCAQKNKWINVYQNFEWPEEPIVQTVIFSNILCTINDSIVMHETYYKLKCNALLRRLRQYRRQGNI